SVARPTDRANLRSAPTELYAAARRRRVLDPAPPVLAAVRDATWRTCNPRPRWAIATPSRSRRCDGPGGTRLAEARTPGGEHHGHTHTSPLLSSFAVLARHGRSRIRRRGPAAGAHPGRAGAFLGRARCVRRRGERDRWPRSGLQRDVLWRMPLDPRGRRRRQPAGRTPLRDHDPPRP